MFVFLPVSCLFPISSTYICPSLLQMQPARWQQLQQQQQHWSLGTDCVLGDAYSKAIEYKSNFSDKKFWGTSIYIYMLLIFGEFIVRFSLDKIPQTNCRDKFLWYSHESLGISIYIVMNPPTFPSSLWILGTFPETIVNSNYFIFKLNYFTALFFNPSGTWIWKTLNLTCLSCAWNLY